jgi:hypothetical protein
VVTLVAILSVCASACGNASSIAHNSEAKRVALTKVALTNKQTTVKAAFDRGALVMFSRVLRDMIRDGQFQGRIWQPNYACWQCGAQIGAVTAILGRSEPGKGWERLTVDTFDVLLADHYLPDVGAFGPPANGGELQTATVVVAMGTAYLELASQLPPQVLAQWRGVIDRADVWLAARRYYYVNGNINLQVTLALYIGWLVTGHRSLLNAYHGSLQFTLDPGPSWPGFGIHYTKVPTRPGGVNGAAYLAEEGTGAPGFDPHYTILQADYAAELYELSGQQSILRLLNLLFNQLRTRLNETTLVIWTGAGSRHPQPDVSGNFESGSLPVLAFANRAHDLLRLVPKQLALVNVDFHNYVKVDNDQDQVIANYAMTLIGLGAPISLTKTKSPSSKGPTSR